MPRDGTHRIRTIDPDFWRHPKTLRLQSRDPLALILLIGIRSAVVDDAGRFRADEHYLKAEILPLVADVTPERVVEALALLEELKLIHRYQADGETYGIVHDWWDWQRVDRPLAPMLPAPPTELCRCCDPAHIRRVLRHAHVSQAFLAALLQDNSSPERPRAGASPGDEPTTPVAAQEEAGSPPGVVQEESESNPGGLGDRQDRTGGGTEGASAPRPISAVSPSRPATRSASSPPLRLSAQVNADGDARASPECPWCARPRTGAKSAVHRLLQHCHDSYRDRIGDCPTLKPDKHGKLLQGLLRAGKTEERIAQVWAAYLESTDSLAERNGHDIETFARLFDGVARAVDQGRQHGGTRDHSRTNPRRHLPSPASDFGDSGLVEL